MSKDFLIDQKHTQIAAILNITPDSFSDRNLYYDPEKALQQAVKLEQEGADLLDIGAESTRPGSKLLTAAEEIARLKPVLPLLRKNCHIPFSLDTRKAEVARFAVAEGVTIINDVTGLLADSALASLVAETQSYIIIMFNAVVARPNHAESRLFPDFLSEQASDIFSASDYEKMAHLPILDLVRFYLEKSLCVAKKAGIKEEKILLDPGIGFGLTKNENLSLLKNIEQIQNMGFPIFLGVSRKRFVVQILQNIGLEADPKLKAGFIHRDQASAAITAYAASKGISVVRTHTVKEHKIAAEIGSAIYQSTPRD